MEITDKQQILENTKKKYKGLLEAFEVDTGNMEQELLEIDQEIMQEIQEERNLELDNLPSSLQESIIKEQEMIEDFTIIRKVLRNTLEKIDLVIDKFGRDMALSNSEDISAAFVTSFAELVKGSNDTAKTLADSYIKASETQLKVKKLLQEVQEVDSSNENKSTVNNILIASTADILKQIKG